MCDQIRGEPYPPVPVAEINHTLRRLPKRIRVIRLRGDRSVETRQSLIQTLQVHKHNASVVKGVGVVRVDGDRSIEACQSLVWTPQLQKGAPSTVKGFRI